jgi:2-dehydropantoate 2-reductase
MKILVLGAGAVGGYFGARLVEAGADVTFLVRDRRRSQLTRDGLRLTSPLGDLTRTVATAGAADVRPEYDVVVLTCKAYDLDAAMEAIAPAMHATTFVVPLLNGMAHLERLDARFGPDRVAGGTCAIDVTLTDDAIVQHSGTLQRLAFGERDRATSPRMEALAEVFATSKIDWELSADIQRAMWDKIVFLAALATGCCLFRGNVHEIIAAPGGRDAMIRAVTANAAIAAREGYAQSESALDFAIKRLTHPTGTWSASMLRDLESGGQVEGDHVVGWMLAKARAHGVDDTMLSLAYTHLKTFETRRDEGRLTGR